MGQINYLFVDIIMYLRITQINNIFILNAIYTGCLSNEFNSDFIIYWSKY